MPNSLSTAEAAKKLDISERTIRQWIHDGHIKAAKLNPRSKSVYRIPLDEIRRVIAERAGTNKPG